MLKFTAPDSRAKRLQTAIASHLPGTGENAVHIAMLATDLCLSLFDEGPSIQAEPGHITAILKATMLSPDWERKAVGKLLACLCRSHEFDDLPELLGAEPTMDEGDALEMEEKFWGEMEES